MSEHLKNFELRFHDYCIQADHRNVAKNPETERADYYKKPLLEISKLRRPTWTSSLKTCSKCGINDHSSRFGLETGPPRNKNNRGKLTNGKLRAGIEATEHLAAGPNRTSVWANHTSAAHDKWPTPCGILYWWLPRTMLLPGNTANTQCPHRPRKEKVLCYSAHVCSWEQIHPNDIPDRHRRHLQYLIWRCPSQADA